MRCAFLPRAETCSQHVGSGQTVRLALLGHAWDDIRLKHVSVGCVGPNLFAFLTAGGPFRVLPTARARFFPLLFRAEDHAARRCGPALGDMFSVRGYGQVAASVVDFAFPDLGSNSVKGLSKRGAGRRSNSRHAGGRVPLKRFLRLALGLPSSLPYVLSGPQDLDFPGLVGAMRGRVVGAVRASATWSCLLVSHGTP